MFVPTNEQVADGTYLKFPGAYFPKPPLENMFTTCEKPEAKPSDADSVHLGTTSKIKAIEN